MIKINFFSFKNNDILILIQQQKIYKLEENKCLTFDKTKSVFHLISSKNT